MSRTAEEGSIQDPLAASRAMPQLTDLTRPYWTGGARGQLLIWRCGRCGRWVHPPTEVCPACGAADLSPQPTSGRGRVFTYTVNHHPYNPATPLPYVIAIVELEEQAGLRVIADLVEVEPDAVRVDMAVRVRFEDHGETFVPVFTPA